MCGWPGKQMLAMPPLAPSAIVFVKQGLAALTFDGLAETFWWQALIGQNTLETTGRSAVVVQVTLGAGGGVGAYAGSHSGRRHRRSPHWWCGL